MMMQHFKTVKSYISQQKESEFYEGFEKSCKELQEALGSPQSKKLQSLEVLIDELENISDEKIKQILKDNNLL